MKKNKTVFCLLYLAAAAAAAIYAVCSYHYDLEFYPHADSVVCLSVFAVCSVFMTMAGNSLISLAVSIAAVIAASVFYLHCSFLVLPGLLTVCAFRNIGSAEKTGKLCRIISFALTGAAFVPFLISCVKAAEMNAEIRFGRDSVFGIVLRGLLFVEAAFFVFLFIKSFSVVRTRRAGPEKGGQKKEAARPVYPESLHTVYLLAAFSVLCAAVYGTFTDDNALVCTAVISWAGCCAALYLSGEPVAAYLHEKAAAFFGIPADAEQKKK